MNKIQDQPPPKETNTNLFLNKLKKHLPLRNIIGIILGGLGGFLYYYFIGCTSGACPLQSNPGYNIFVGILLGYLVSDLFKKKNSA